MTEAKSETPRTDEQAHMVVPASPFPLGPQQDYECVPAELARTLERENATLRAQLADMSIARDVAEKRLAEMSEHGNQMVGLLSGANIDHKDATIRVLRDRIAKAEWCERHSAGQVIEWSKIATDEKQRAEAAERALKERDEDAERYRWLREQAGHVEDGSSQTVGFFQDDATRCWHIRAGSKHYGCDDRSLNSVIDAAKSGTP